MVTPWLSLQVHMHHIQSGLSQMGNLHAFMLPQKATNTPHQQQLQVCIQMYRKMCHRLRDSVSGCECDFTQPWAHLFEHAFTCRSHLKWHLRIILIYFELIWVKPKYVHFLSGCQREVGAEILTYRRMYEEEGIAASSPIFLVSASAFYSHIEIIKLTL